MSEYIWLIGGVGGAIANAIVIWNSRESATFTRQRARRFAIGLCLFVSIPSIALWLIQASIPGQASFDFREWPIPQKQIAFTIAYGCASLALIWVYFCGGAKVFADYATATGKASDFMCTPLGVKIASVLVFAVALLCAG